METSVTGPSQPTGRCEESPKPQAEPLPRKRGEIGYVEGHHGQEDRSSSSSPDIVLPPRHPADREAEQGPAVDIAQSAQAANIQISSARNPQSTTSEVASTLVSVSASKQGRQFLGLFKCKHTHTNTSKVAGIELPTLTRFVLQLVVFCGSIVGWVLLTKFLTRKTSGDGNVSGGPSSIIFMHVIFGIGALGQILLLERRIFRMRAERYSHLHPGEVLTSFRNRQTVPDELIAFSPWNRPPLPTYAAVLAQSGRGTGDVEDNVIAQQPPPAYGNTRGSTFLLSGYLNESQRLQRPVSAHTTSSRLERPRSYVSRDDEWEEVQNAERARQLEETLAKLERSGSRSSRT